MIKHKLQISLLVLLYSLFIPAGLLAQSQRGPLRNSRIYKGQSNYGIMRVTLGTGTGTYYGDLCESADCFVFRPQFNVGFNHRYTSRVSVRGEFSYIRLYSTDEGGKNFRRNLSFRSGNMELYAAGVVELYRYEKIYNRRPPIRPYAFAGLGVTYISPHAELNNRWYSLAPRNTEGVNYSRFVPVIPFGAGVSFNLHPVWDLSLEAAYRLSFSDYIDDVSTTFTDNSELRARDPIAAALADRSLEAGIRPWNSDDGQHWREGHKRGNPDRNDGYFTMDIKVEYTINPIIKPKRGMIRIGGPKFGTAKRKNFGFSSGRRKRR